MANKQTLQPFTSEQSRDEAVKNGRKGGKASGEARRRKRDMKERLQILLSMSIKDGKGADIEKIKNFGSLKGENITVEDAILVAMIQKALKGDVSASNFIRDTSGQKVVDKVEINTNIDESVREIEEYIRNK